MKNTIGILREGADKHGEKRAAITPENAKQITDWGYKLFFEPAVDPITGDIKRAFRDSNYSNIGAEIRNNLAVAKIIFGLKEISVKKILPNKVYLFFSHTHKGQVKNRKMLKELIQNKSTLIDYELITDSKNKRLITAFTYIAGSAGMVDTLWSLGKKLRLQEMANPFENIAQSIEAGNMKNVKKMLTKASDKIISIGTPKELPPIVCCILGKGKTSKGATQMLNYLPCEDITIEQLPEIFNSGERNKIYKLVLEVYDIYKLKSEYKNVIIGSLEKEKINHYINNPNMYESNMKNILPFVTLLMNCIIWSEKYPRVLSKILLKEIYSKNKTLTVIGDVTCDPNGSIEFSKETWIDNPVYNYNPIDKTYGDGFKKNGVTVMAVTNLPCEFSEDASEKFSNQLLPFLEGIVSANYEEDISKSGLPAPIKNAVIMWQGTFTNNFKYMEKYI